MNKIFSNYIDQKKWEPLRKVSIAFFIIIAFVMVAAILLTGFGFINYKLDKDRQWKRLQQELARTADELKLTLALPAWNLDYAQIDNIIESSMSNQNIYGMIINVEGSVRMRARGDDWKIISPAKKFSSDGLLLEKRDIIFSGQKLGTINLFGSTKIMKKNIMITSISIMSFISAFVFIIIIGLYIVLHIVVLKPVMNIDQYTKAINAGNRKVLKVKGSYFQGELDTLRSSIEKMIDTHEDRFIDLLNEMELRTESEKRFRTIFDSSNDALLICDKNTGEILYVNEKVCEMFGYTYSEVIDNNISMIREDETQQTRDNNIESFVNSSKKSYEGECKATHKNGNVFWVEVSIKDVIIDNQKRALIAIRDISQRKQAEEDRRLSEIKYRNIFERSIEGIFQSTYEGKILSVNPAMARIYGYDSPEDILREVETAKNTYVNPEERMRFLDHLERYGRIEGFEAQFYTKDRKIIWVSLSARTVSDIDGKVLYYEGTAMDITTRKKAEEEKERLEAQLRQSQKIEAIGTLAGGIAHDFNNILSVVSGYGSILQMELEKADSPLRNYASQILLASEKAVGLTKSLLAFSRKQPVQLQPLKLNEIINGVHKLLETLLTEDIVMQKNLSEKDIVIMGDATQIDQILFNLATNARDAMPGGGSLTVETRLMELKDGFTDILGYVEPGIYALLSVSDTGNGIDEKTKEHIFDPFFTTKDVGKGTGLGLSTVYGVVKQHNGYITVYSELGMGTTFHIYFPALLSKIEDKKIESSPTEGGNETILIAEDNESVRYLMKTILTKFGYSVIEAKDGEEAVQRYRENDIIDLMIIDSVMPKKNGREVYDEIKKDEPDIKVLFTSGYTRDIVLDKGIEEKEVEFISKPLSPNALLKKVRKILDAH